MNDTYNFNDIEEVPEMPEEHLQEIITHLKGLRRVSAPKSFERDLFARIRMTDSRDTGESATILPIAPVQPWYASFARVRESMRPAYAVAAVVVIGAFALYEYHGVLNTTNSKTEIAVTHNAGTANALPNLADVAPEHAELRPTPRLQESVETHNTNPGTSHNTVVEKSIRNSPTAGAASMADKMNSSRVQSAQAVRVGNQSGSKVDNRVIQTNEQNSGQQAESNPPIYLMVPPPASTAGQFSSASYGTPEEQGLNNGINAVDTTPNAAAGALQMGRDSLNSRNARHTRHAVEPKK